MIGMNITPRYALPYLHLKFILSYYTSSFHLYFCRTVDDDHHFCNYYLNHHIQSHHHLTGVFRNFSSFDRVFYLCLSQVCLSRVFLLCLTIAVVATTAIGASIKVGRAAVLASIKHLPIFLF
uniref:Uncharacterized protein n=1 Tax=Ditylum brightwellii TaxID=49249 RepID=A0A7S4V2R7_9STRA